MSEPSAGEHKCPGCGSDAPAGGSGHAPHCPCGRPSGDSEIARHYAFYEQQRPVAQLMQRLTPGEQKVLGLLVAGHRAAAVAALFGVSLPTVHDHIRAILAKLEVRSQLEAVAMVFDQLDTRGPGGAPEGTA
jgi:DNA-binding CsgD family transcriptional regulator